jgi:hypothetical protein
MLFVVNDSMAKANQHGKNTTTCYYNVLSVLKVFVYTTWMFNVKYNKYANQCNFI